MSDISIAALNGKIDAIGQVLTQVLSTMTPLQAAQACVGLATELDALRREADSEAPEEQLAVQEAVLDAYLGLLSSVAHSD